MNSNSGEDELVRDSDDRYNDIREIDDVTVSRHYSDEISGRFDSESTLSLRPPPSTPVFVYLLTALCAIGGFLFGYDTGIVSGAMIIIRENFELSTLWHEMIVSGTIGMAAIFSLIGGYMNNAFGRKKVILAASFIFTAGAVCMGVSNTKEILLVGRLIVGMGLGLASMTVPIYIAEMAPPHLRGRLIVMNNLFITGGQCIACLVAGAFSYDTVDGWRYMLGLAAIPSSVQFIAFMFMPESPRWLVMMGKEQKALRVLISVRSTDEDVRDELASLRRNMTDSTAEENGQNRFLLWEMLRTPHLRRALIVGCGLQMFQQICGINTIMYYSASIIQMAGVTNISIAIWLSAVTAFINFIFTTMGLYAIDKSGRRKLSLISLLGTAVSLLILGVVFYFISYVSPDISYWEEAAQTTTCYSYTTCSSCVTDTDCGFCYIINGTGASLGSCLKVAEFSDYNSLTGRCTNSTTELMSDTVWAYNYCPTSFSYLAVAALCLYLAWFAPGMGCTPWTINSEIYPTWARSTGNSLSTTTNWVFNLLVSMTFLTLTEVLTTAGAFFLYTTFAVVGLVFLFCCLPETKGRPLEHIEALFMRPWSDLIFRKNDYNNVSREDEW